MNIGKCQSFKNPLQFNGTEFFERQELNIAAYEEK